MKFADLHLHTNASDGTFTPEEVVLKSKKSGLAAISIVDHDTVDALDAALKIAKDNEIEIIPGIELSAECDGKEIHILGYLIDHRNNDLTAKIKILKTNRIDRVHKITEKLKDLGVALSPKTVFDIAQDGIISRLHIARALVEAGAVTTTGEAFRRYIGDSSPAYVLGFKMQPEETISLIKNAGGIPVLAHPYSLHSDELTLKLIEFGIMGLEVYYPEHSQGMINFYLDLAKKYNLLVTGGSDCHGAAKPEVKIGSIKIPYNLVERLKEVKDKM
ncbi:MAG: PHP domain-containing protein [Candidatus Omnitrophota bacterium]